MIAIQDQYGQGTAGAVFLQWKGTDACLDLSCPSCHRASHYDGEFAYSVRCPYCGAAWRLQSVLAVEPAPDDDDPVDAFDPFADVTA